MPRQLILELPVRTARGRDDFFVSDANAMAVARLEDAEGWANGRLVLTGPRGAGKTHLVHVWAEVAGARISYALVKGGGEEADFLASSSTETTM